jgi:hypothetical protein
MKSSGNTLGGGGETAVGSVGGAGAGGAGSGAPGRRWISGRVVKGSSATWALENPAGMAMTT